MSLTIQTVKSIRQSELHIMYYAWNVKATKNTSLEYLNLSYNLVLSFKGEEMVWIGFPASDAQNHTIQRSADS